MNTILVVDDESKIREVIKEYGKVNGYNVLEAQDGDSAIEIVKKEKINCIILDIMLPNFDGFTACQMIKKICNTPIIMLSARVSEEDKLLGFDLGVDDYVEKPFSPKVLMAKIKVVIDRNMAANSSNLIQFDGVSVDIEGHTVKVDDNLVHLTNKEFDLLLYFLKNPNIAISRDSLLTNIWGDDFIGFDRTVDAHIKMLRKNLGAYGDRIVTIRGVGYKFEK